MTDTYPFDVFISYSSKDKAIACDLATRLRTKRVRVWFDEWEIRVGESIPRKIEEGLQHSRVLLFLMSPDALGSDWATLERHTILFRDAGNLDRSFLPVLIRTCAIPDMLRQYRYSDWQADPEAAFTQLLEVIRPGAGRRRTIAKKTPQPESAVPAGPTADPMGERDAERLAAFRDRIVRALAEKPAAIGGIAKALSEVSAGVAPTEPLTADWLADRLLASDVGTVFKAVRRAHRTVMEASDNGRRLGAMADAGTACLKVAQ